ncbi:uncharacterized protein MAM_04367 [Metarhizium album ARSEF 1941]|uniref:NLP/P60 protein n=1 Tax=Metarhizium album (strain ARSEF 1941) TaxID=1081103 RepID=A0A0B2WV75_METAS|nr:uncharacterized protein MAM_04367 [Metarhizium album ARSEF 1941]KHN97978.1 hypothetical protein MAM_04367 [Metarhizium album ARSEF 1941]
MKVCAVLAAVAVGATSAAGLEGWSYTGLTELQSKYARRITAQARKEELGAQGCQAAIATALMESTLIMHANSAVPGSLAFHHDRLGYDGDSVGLFQQRASIYTDLGCSMNAACSAHQFFVEMRDVPDWESMDVGTLCQAVQRSQNPERYYEFIDLAASVCAEAGL